MTPDSNLGRSAIIGTTTQNVMSNRLPHRDSDSSSRSAGSEHAFPFQHEEHGPHATLLPDGILNDDDDIVPWPSKASKDDASERAAVLKVRKLPQDMTGREFAGLFLMADGYQDSELALEMDEVRSASLRRARQSLTSL